MTSRRPGPRPGLLDIAPYVPGRSKAAPGVKLHKLSSNETPLGPSPAAIAAYRDASGSLELYPDGGATALREAIGATHGINPDRIVCGSGSDEILHLIANAYIGPGDEAIYTEHGFLVYPIVIRSMGGTPVVAPEVDLTANVDAILARLTARTRVVFLANPNNPTGTYLPFSEIRRLHANLPPDVVLVLDAAYAEYVRRNDYESGIELAGSADNVIMTRTFSKIYGLAGLRIGWGYGSAHILDVIHRVRGPFNVSGPSIAAGVAAILDRGHTERAVAHNEAWLARMTAGLTAPGPKGTPRGANFILVHLPGEKGRTAADADAFLVSRGVVVRRIEAYGLPNALRVTIGSAEANAAVVAGFRDFLAGSR